MMKINRIQLHNFRNYADEEFVFAPGVNVISGENAQGKTNLLEAAAALSTIKLFRTGQKKEGLRFGADEGSVTGEFEAEGREFSVALRAVCTESRRGLAGRRAPEAAGRRARHPQNRAVLPGRPVSHPRGASPGGGFSIPRCASCARTMTGCSGNTNACWHIKTGF